MEISKIVHIAFAIQFIRRKVELDWKNVRPFVKPKNKRAFLKGLDELERKGFEVVPPCSYHNKKGFCNGHKQKETAPKQSLV